LWAEPFEFVEWTVDIDIVYFTPSLFVQWLGIGGKLSVVPMMTGLHCPIFVDFWNFIDFNP